MRKTVGRSCARARGPTTKAPNTATTKKAIAEDRTNMRNTSAAARALGVTTGSNTGHRAIFITRSTLMSPVRAGLVMMGFSVTTDARYVGVVGLIDMAIRTHCAVMRQAPEVVVIEGGPQPARC